MHGAVAAGSDGTGRIAKSACLRDCVAHLHENLAAASPTLPDDAVAELNAISERTGA